YESALAQAEASPPDAVISDIGLPGRDGLMLMRELSRRYGVPGIAVSGHRLDDDALRDAGFVAHLLKPIVFDHLLRVLADARASAAVPAARAPRRARAARRRRRPSTPADPMPRHVAPMLAVLAADLPSDGKNWAFEYKWDGVRAIAYNDDDGLTLESRNRLDI